VGGWRIHERQGEHRSSESRASVARVSKAEKSWKENEHWLVKMLQRW